MASILAIFPGILARLSGPNKFAATAEAQVPDLSVILSDVTEQVPSDEPVQSSCREIHHRVPGKGSCQHRSRSRSRVGGCCARETRPVIDASELTSVGIRARFWFSVSRCVMGEDKVASYDMLVAGE